MAHKKAAGSTRLGRDSRAQRLGVKVFGDQRINAGGIIVRQRGAKYHAGDNVGKGGDDTLFALITGMVKFQEKRVVTFSSNKGKRMFVHVVETEEPKNLRTQKPVVSPLLGNTRGKLKDTAKNTAKDDIEKEKTDTNEAVVEKKEVKPAAKK